jgi:hypothetical protein
LLSGHDAALPSPLDHFGFGNGQLTPGCLVRRRSGAISWFMPSMSDGLNRTIAMKSSTSLLAAITVLAAAFSVGAQAQTGRPSTVEVKAAADTARVVAADEELGSYARYLMLNGATREEAVAAARNIDHPAPRNVLASRSHAGATAAPRQ